MTDDRKPKPPGMAAAPAKFVGETDAAVTWVTDADALLEKLVDDYYEAAIDAAGLTNAAQTAREAIDPEIRQVGEVDLSLLFSAAGTLYPNRTDVLEYARGESGDQAEEIAEAVMQHLANHRERITASFEAQDWSLNQIRFERAEGQKAEAFNRMLATPTQGVKGIRAKVKAMVPPPAWKVMCREGVYTEDRIAAEMLVSIVADLERLTGEGVVINAGDVLLGGGCYFLQIAGYRVVADPTIRAKPGAVVILWERKRGPRLVRVMARGGPHFSHYHFRFLDTGRLFKLIARDVTAYHAVVAGVPPHQVGRRLVGES